MSTLVFAHSSASRLYRLRLWLLSARFSPFIRPPALLRALEDLGQTALMCSDFDANVHLGCHVSLRNSDSGEILEWEIVLPQHSAPRRGRLSCLSALGMALLGKKVGDLVTVDALGSRPGFLIINIRRTQKED